MKIRTIILGFAVLQFALDSFAQSTNVVAATVTNSQQPPVCLQILFGFAQIVTGIATAWLLWQTVRLSRATKVTDIIVEANRRYDALWRDRIRGEGKADPELWYKRYWSLQFDQFRHFKNGFVDDETFLHWMKTRHDEWQINEAFEKTNYQEGFEGTMKKWPYNREFKGFMIEVFTGSVEEAIKRLSRKKRRIMF